MVPLGRVFLEVARLRTYTLAGLSVGINLLILFFFPAWSLSPSQADRRAAQGPRRYISSPGSGPQSITLTLAIKCAGEGEAEPGCCEVCHGV